MKAIIIDDEKRARQLLATILAENCPEVTLCGDAEDLPNGVKLIHKTKPDIIFLDIEMPGHSGLEILDFFLEYIIRNTLSIAIMVTNKQLAAKPTVIFIFLILCRNCRHSFCTEG